MHPFRSPIHHQDPSAPSQNLLGSSDQDGKVAFPNILRMDLGFRKKNTQFGGKTIEFEKLGEPSQPEVLLGFTTKRYTHPPVSLQKNMFAATKHNSCFFPVDFSESASTTTTNISFTKLQKVVCCKQKRYTDHLKKSWKHHGSTIQYTTYKTNPESPTSLPFFCVQLFRRFVFQKTPPKKKLSLQKLLKGTSRKPRGTEFPGFCISEIPNFHRGGRKLCQGPMEACT